MSSPLKIFVNPVWEQWQASMNIRFKDDEGQSKRAKPYCRSKSIPFLLEKMHRKLSFQKNTMPKKEKKKLWKALVELEEIGAIFYELNMIASGIVEQGYPEYYPLVNVEGKK